VRWKCEQSNRRKENAWGADSCRCSGAVAHSFSELVSGWRRLIALCVCDTSYRDSASELLFHKIFQMRRFGVTSKHPSTSEVIKKIFPSHLLAPMPDVLIKSGDLHSTVSYARLECPLGAVVHQKPEGGREDGRGGAGGG